MSKKDYIAIAKALRPVAIRSASPSSGHGYQQAANDCLEALASVFSEDNCNFKRGRWFAYLRGECGPNGGAVKSK